MILKTNGSLRAIGVNSILELSAPGADLGARLVPSPF